LEKIAIVVLLLIEKTDFLTVLLGIGRCIMKTKMLGMLSESIVLGLVLPTLLFAAPEKMFFVDSNNGGSAVARIWQANLDGSNKVALFPPGLNPRYIALDLDEEKIYWTDIGGIRRANLDGSNIENGFIYGLPAAKGIAIDKKAGKIYWTDTSTGEIQRANLDSTGVESLVINLSRPHGMAIDTDGGKIYWVDQTTKKVQRANLNGSDVEDLVLNVHWPQDIALNVSQGRMYWLSDSWMYSAKLDGSDIKKLFFTENALGLAIDSDKKKVYWTNSERKKVQRANLDGTAKEDVVTSDLDTPWGIALALYPALEVSIDLRPGCKENTINLGSSGVIPVAIMSSKYFDALTIKEDSIRLSGTAVKLAGKSSNYLCQRRDVNKDGLLDLVCDVEIKNFLLQEGTDMVELTGETTSGTKIIGTDYLKIVP
jgi:hypothetical protein